MNLDNAKVTPVYSAAFFVDTNILRGSPFLLGDAEAQEFLRLAGQFKALVAIPDIVFLEYSDHLEQKTRDSRSKGNECAAELRRLGLQATFESERKDSLPNHVAARLQAELECLHIKVCVCPCENLSLRTLMEAAVRKVAPFQEGDKGFRDALFLESCLGCLRGIQTRLAVVVTKDRIFGDPEIARRFEEAGVPLGVVGNFAEAIETLNGLVDDIIAREVQQRNNAAKAFLEGHASEVKQFAASQARFTRRSLVYLQGRPGWPLGFVEYVHALEIGDIQSAVAAPANDSGVTTITCYIACSLTLVVKPDDLSWLADEIPIGHAPTEGLRYPARIDRVTAPVDAQVHVEAEATEEEPGKFSDLKLIGATLVG